MSENDRSAYKESQLIKTDDETMQKLLNFPLGYEKFKTPDVIANKVMKEKRAQSAMQNTRKK